MSMRRPSADRASTRIGLFVSTCVALAFGANVARAEPPGPGSASPAPGGRTRATTPLALKRDQASSADAQAARSRARAGDCAGALPFFDAAIRSTIEPTLRRDRGLCHEKLGHPYPAIDDYRAYLTAGSEVPDAESIRQRLSSLEEQVGISGPAAGPTKDSESEWPSDDTSGKTGGKGEASVSASEHGVRGSASSSAQKSSALGPKAGEREKDFDDHVRQEQLDDSASSSPLRYGKGFVIGAFLGIPRFFFGEDASKKLAYVAGGTFRYSIGPTVTLLSEVGVAGIGTSGEVSSFSGAMLFGGVEFRLPLSPLGGDHLLFRGGVGYERYVITGTRLTVNDLLGRFGAGYRHVFGPAMGLEFLVDGGPALVMPESLDQRIHAVIGGSVAFVVGF